VSGEAQRRRGEVVSQSPISRCHSATVSSHRHPRGTAAHPTECVVHRNEWSGVEWYCTVTCGPSDSSPARHPDSRMLHSAAASKRKHIECTQSALSRASANTQDGIEWPQQSTKTSEKIKTISKQSVAEKSLRKIQMQLQQPLQLC